MTGPLKVVWACLAFQSAGAAVVGAAEISGFVKDSSEAIIVGATVTALSEHTGTRREVTTDSKGRYAIPFLAPGQYRVTAQIRGFNPASQSGIRLVGGQLARVDFSLGVPVLETSVTVRGTGSALKSSSGTVSTSLDRRLIGDLPLNGRSMQPMLELIPGVVLTKTASLEQGQFSVNGQRANANGFTIDGVSANVGVFVVPSLGQAGGGSLPGLSTAGGTNSLVSVEALEEVHIQTSSYGPEFGRTPGAQVSLTTRSGGNEWHGSLFEYFRNSALDASDWFAKRAGLPKPVLGQNQFGATLGGPLVKDRTFFFLSYEGLRLHQPQTAMTVVPRLAARVTAPESLQPFLRAFPSPNGSAIPNTVLADFSASYSDPSQLDVTSLRLDHTLSDRATLFARYSFAPSETTQRGPDDSLSTLKTTAFTTQTLTAGATVVLSSNTTNVFRANWSQNRGFASNQLDDFGGAEPPDPSLFPVSPDRALYSFQIAGTGGSARFLLGRNPEQVQRQVNLVDTLSIAAGRHEMQFGVDYRNLFPTFDPFIYSQDVQFSSESDPRITTRSLFGGKPNILLTANAGPRSPRFLSLSTFIQDNWRVSPRLGLAYGLRWEFAPAPSEGTGKEPLALMSGPGSTPSPAPPGTPLWRTTYGNFAPRVSVVYELSQREGHECVLRGGFGVYYDVAHSAAGSAYAIGMAPFTRSASLQSRYPMDASAAMGVLRDLSSPPVGVTQLNVAFDPNLKLPYTMQWNVTTEQGLGPNHRILVSYLGSAGRRLLVQQREMLLGDHAARLEVDNLFTNAGSSDYHGLQVQFQRSLWKGLQALASYTWSHSIDTASDESPTRAPVPGEIVDAAGTRRTYNRQFNASVNRGPSDFDVRHSLSAAITYELPSPGRGGLLASILQNWSLDGILRARSAAPVNVLIFNDPSTRPNLVPGQPLYLDDPEAPGGRRLNPAAFHRHFDSLQGSLGRNALRGFPAWQVDLAARRSFDLSARVRLRLSAEAFNLLNHPNFGEPEPQLGSPYFGLSTQMLGSSLGGGGRNGGFSPIYQMGGPRSVQLALRLQF